MSCENDPEKSLCVRRSRSPSSLTWPPSLIAITAAMRRRDALWRALFGAFASAWLAVGIWIHFGAEPSHLLFVLMAACGVALSAAFHILRVRGIWPKRPGDGVRR